MNTVTPETRQKISLWEGVRLHAYDDATGKDINVGDKVRGTLTIGVGHTGPDVTPGLTISAERADALLDNDLQASANAVRAAVTVPLTDQQFGTLVSFTFNVGIGAFRSSTLLRLLNTGDYAAVPTELMKWTKTRINGQLVSSPGLVRRRSAEAAYWAEGTTAVTTSAPLPEPAVTAQQGAVAVKDAPSWITPESIATASGAVSAAGAVTSGNGPIQYALAAILVIAVCVGIYLFVIKRMRPV